MRIVPQPENQGQASLDNPYFCKIIIAILLDRQGGEATINQADFDRVAYCSLLEGECVKTGGIVFKVQHPPKV